jgi:hypothetical protein
MGQLVSLSPTALRSLHVHFQGLIMPSGFSSSITPRIGALVVGLTAPIYAGGLMAQGAPQSITEKRVDVVQLATGYRASKLIGSNVENGDKAKIGTVDDIIVSPSDQEPYAILSVGGFLGIGKRLVAIPFKDVHIADKRLRMDGATKDSLRALPEFHYAKD